MRDESPTNVHLNGEPEEPVRDARKSRSGKHFLLSTTAGLGLLIGGLGLLGLLAWSARNDLATAAAKSFLKGKGIDADISLQNLQLDGAQIHDLRMGPESAPTLSLKTAQLKWRYDSKSGLLVIERLEADDLTLELGLNKTGAIDFGALAPLMAPSSGPKRKLIQDVSISNAKVVLNTPQGRARAALKVWGGEQTAWTGRADLVPPAPFIIDQSRPFTPIRLGFSVKPSVVGANNQASPLLVGFALLPAGQSLAFQDFRADRLSAKIIGQLTLQPGSSLRVDTRPMDISADAIAAPGLRVANLSVATNSAFWTHAKSWQTDGWGSVSADARFGRLAIESAKQSLQNGLLRLGGARAQSGRMQFDYDVSTQSALGPLSARQLSAKGNVSTQLADLSKLAGAEFVGTGVFGGQAITLPTNVNNLVPAGLPPALRDIVKGRFSGTGAFNYRLSKKDGQISLAGPFRVNGSTGLRAALNPAQGGTPTLRYQIEQNGKVETSAIASGNMAIEIPKLGMVRGQIDGAAFSPAGWAINARDLMLSSQNIWQGANTQLRFQKLEASAMRGRPIRGRGTGQAFVTTATGDSASLAFALDATPSQLSGSIKGSVEGFGRYFGPKGYGLRSGTLDLTGTARRQGRNWQGSGQGQIQGASFTVDQVALSGPTVQVSGNGQITDKGALNGQVSLSGSIASARPNQSVAGTGLAGLNFNNRTSFAGTTSNLRLSGILNAASDRIVTNALALDDATTNIAYDGSLAGSQSRIQGLHTSRLGRFQNKTQSPSGQVDINNARASGPFAIQTGIGPGATPFWAGKLVLTGSRLSTELALAADRVMAANSDIKGLQLNAPLAATLTGSGLRVSSDVNLSIQRLTSGEMDIANVRAAGPFNALTSSNGWQIDSKLDLRASGLQTGQTRLGGVIGNGEIAARLGPNNLIRIASPACFNFGAQNGAFPGEARIGAVSGKLCPDANGLMALIGTPTPQILASAKFDPLTVQIGSVENGQSLELSDVLGTLKRRPDGTLGLNIVTNQFGFNLKMPDGTTAVFNASDASLDVLPSRDGIDLRGEVGRVSSIGLPVFVSGGATTQFLINNRGLSGSFNFDDIILKDIEKSPRFGEVQLVGSGTLIGNQVSLAGDVLDPASTLKLASITLSHDISQGAGNLDVSAKDLLFAPAPVAGKPGVNIVDLIPSLRGVVLDMTGVASASANLAWARERPIVSRAQIKTSGLDFGTMLGPMTGLTGDVSLDDILAVRTPPNQTIKIALFDPGLPIEGGVVQFTLPGNNSLRLENASWPFADGQLSVRPATWQFRDGDQSFAIDVENVDLAKLLRLTEVPNLEIDGRVSGVFPIEVKNGNVEIIGGRLKAREGGGVIRYTGPGAAPPPPPPGFIARMRQRLFGKPMPAGADLAIEALRALEYKILEITVDGRITGELKMGVILEGANKQVLSGVPFKFNIKMNVPVGQLMDNIKDLPNSATSPEALKEIDRVLREDANTPAKPPTPPPPPPAP